MTDNKLEILRKHRDAILLAEIGALIHDLGKLHKQFVIQHAEDYSGLKDYHHGDVLEEDAKRDDKLGELAKNLKELLEKCKVKVPDEDTNLHELVKKHHDDSDQRILMKLTIAADKFDAEEDRAQAKDKQMSCKTYKSSSFGYETEINLDEFEESRQIIYEKLIEVLDTCDFNKIIEKRKELFAVLKKCFSKVLGETQRSANDVTLWDHSYMTASIMKALVAYNVLDSSFIVSSKEDIIKNKPFSIFAVGWNFFEFAKQSHKIPDVIGRIKIIEEIKDCIREIVEEKYALGNSIYDDDFGIYFLIPSVVSDKDLKDVKEEIFDIFNEKVSGIILPVFHLEEPNPNEEFRIGKLLTNTIDKIKEKIRKHEVDLVKNPKWIDEWENSVELPKEKLICNVCGRGYYPREDKEKICDTCREIRNKGREKSSESNLQTIFIDEIAWNPEKKQYENVCLLIAKFDLDEWLNGKLVRSLFIRNPEKDYDDLKWKNGKSITGLAGILGKTLRDRISSNIWDEEAKKKVYDAIKLFIHDKAPIIKGNSAETVALRVIKLIEEEIKDGKTLKDILNKEKHEHFISNTAFDFEYLDNIVLLKPPSPSRLMRIWNNTKDFFEDIAKEICLKVSLIKEYKLILENEIEGLIPNMAYILEIDNKAIGEVITLKEKSKELFVITPHTNDYLLKNKDKLKGKKIVLSHPDSKEQKGEGKINDIVEKGRAVRTYRIISISPTLFMAIIPASKSMEIVKMIKEKYLEHFGKVFGKLPLHVGLIYFKRKMPIFAVLDSAMRMINEFESLRNEDKLCVAENPRSEDNYKILELSKKLNKDEHKEYELKYKYKIKIPYKLGDENPDYYHPYLLIENSSDDVIEIKINGNSIVQKHISKIKKNDTIKMRKYHLDFEFLDSNIRRLDIGVKRKHWLFVDSTNKPKPYLLWDIDNFERLRKLIQKLGLTTTQTMNLYEMLMAKIEEWEIREPPIELLNGKNEKEKEKAQVFEKLVENTIKDAPLRLEIVDGETRKGKISREDYEFLKTYILTGMFFDFVDLWHTILKEKFEEKENTRGEEYESV